MVRWLWTTEGTTDLIGHGLIADHQRVSQLVCVHVPTYTHDVRGLKSGWVCWSFLVFTGWSSVWTHCSVNPQAELMSLPVLQQLLHPHSFTLDRLQHGALQHIQTAFKHPEYSSFSAPPQSACVHLEPELRTISGAAGRWQSSGFWLLERSRCLTSAGAGNWGRDGNFWGEGVRAHCGTDSKKGTKT